MINFIENVSRSCVYYMKQAVDAAVTSTDIPVFSGQLYGINLEDPTGKSPSITVSVLDTESSVVELGSNATSIVVVFTIHSLNNMQREFLKSLVYLTLRDKEITIYKEFIDYNPSDFTKLCNAQWGDRISAVNIQNLNSGNEKFFWSAVVSAELILLY